MRLKAINWPIWAGFVLAVIAFLSYPFFFINWPVTRDFPWASLLLFGIAAVLLFFGVRRAFRWVNFGLLLGHPALLRSAAAGLRLYQASGLQTLVRKAGLSDQVRQDVVRAYEELSRHLGGCISGVAVRSSATAEDAADTSFAGMNKTFTNVRGIEELLEAIVQAWASLFGERVLAYRAAHHLEGEPAIAVVVQCDWRVYRRWFALLPYYTRLASRRAHR